MLTLQMNQQRHSMIRPLKTMISLLMFGRVRVTFSLQNAYYLFSEKVWNTIKAFREEMFGERFMN